MAGRRRARTAAPARRVETRAQELARLVAEQHRDDTSRQGRQVLRGKIAGRVYRRG